MTTSQTCPKCGTALPKDTPAGHCPKCLLAVFAGEASPGGATQRGGEPEAGKAGALGKVHYFGDYELEGEIASGGMGIVYLACQISLNRAVALKMIRSGNLATAPEVQRFRTEAEAAAGLDHPNIVPIYEIGEHEGRHYFSMKLVEGGNLAELSASVASRDRHWLKRSARIVRTLARAVHHAHQRGVLHRDIKPTNVLLDEAGEPHLTDFGLAKLVQSGHDMTRTLAILGTPHYMAPEQAAGKAKEVTTATDIYSLGAVLFELIGGRPVFEGESALEVLAKAQKQHPPSLQKLNPAVDADLEIICGKCLEKEPGRRYDTAENLADDLDHWLAGEPIQARPATRLERVVKWTRRNPALASLILLAHTLFIAGIIGVLWQWRRAEGAYRQSAQTVTRLELEKAEDSLEAGKTSEGLAYLASVLRKQPGDRAVAERILSVLARREIPLPLGVPMRHKQTIEDACFSPDGRFVATVSQDHTARLWDARTGAAVSDPLLHSGAVLAVEFSRDGKLLLTTAPSGPARLWSLNADGKSGGVMDFDANVVIARLSPEGGRVMTASSNGSVRVWDVGNGQPLTPPMHHPQAVRCAEFSRAGDRILVGSTDHLVSIWDAATGQKLSEGDFRDSPWCMALHPDGERFFLGCNDGLVRIGRVRDAKLLKDCPTHTHRISYLECSPDGRYVLTVSGDRSARLLDAETGEALSPRLWHDWILRHGAFSPDGRMAATVRLWHVPDGRALTDPFHDVWPARSVRFSPDGGRMVRAVGTNAQMWDVRPGRQQPLRFEHPALVSSLDFSPDGQRLATATWERSAKVWDTRSGKLVAGPFRHNELVWTACFSPDGRRLVTASKDHTAILWDLQSGKALGPPLEHPDFVEAARFTPDGRRIVTNARDHIARVWESERNSQPVREVQLTWPDIWDLSPDGRYLLGGMVSNRAQVVDLETGARVSMFQHGDAVTAVAFSPRGDRVVSGSQGGAIWIWDPQTGRRLAGPCRHENTVFRVVFDADGKRFATAAADDTARLWDANTGGLLIEPLKHESDVTVVRFSPDGLRLVTGSDDGVARIWDAITGQPLNDPFRYDGRVEDAAFTPDSRSLAIASGGTVELWEIPVDLDTIPEWLPELAEAATGLRRTGTTQFEVVPPAQLLNLRDRISASRATDPATRWARWFLADQATRSASP